MRVRKRSRISDVAHKLVCLMMISALPSSLMGQNSSAAMLHTNGPVALDGHPAPVSSALLPEETVQTQKDSTAKIDLTGSTIDVMPETFLQFEGDEIFLEHGTLQVLSSRGLRVRVGCITVIPVNEDWTQFDVTDLNGKVTVASHKNDVRIDSHAKHTQKTRDTQSNSDIVHATEQKTRDEKCGGAGSNPAHATRGVLDTWQAQAAGLAVIGGVTCWVLCVGKSEPISPYEPK